MNFTAKLLIATLIVFAAIHLHYLTEESPTEEDHIPAIEEEALEVVVPDAPLEINVILKRKYVDGEVSEEKVNETIWSLEDFWSKYEDWQLVDIDIERIVFEQEIDDISPLLKVNGFFGLTEDGVLSIFNGTPEQSEIIQSFFQIDIEKLEGKKKDELKQGIPVQSKEVYSQVLETLKNYSIDEDKNNPAYQN